MITMGVDPGVTGGIAFVNNRGSVVAYDIPSVDKTVDVGAVIRLIKKHSPSAAVVERASARPGQGVSSTFKFGMSYGALLAACTACELPVHLVSAAKWKPALGLNKEKEKSRALATRLWPGADCFGRKKDHGRAEAALLAYYHIKRGRTRRPPLKLDGRGAAT